MHYHSDIGESLQIRSHSYYTANVPAMLDSFWYMLVYLVVMIFAVWFLVCMYCACKSRFNDDDMLLPPIPVIEPIHRTEERLSPQELREYIEHIIVSKIITTNKSNGTKNTSHQKIQIKQRSKDGKESQPSDSQDRSETANDVMTHPLQDADLESAVSQKEEELEHTEKDTIMLEEMDPNLCEICLSEYCIGDVVSSSLNPTCTHSFHKDCIVEWLTRTAATGERQQNEMTCPCCRRDYLHTNS